MEETKTGWGSIIATILIIAVVIIGALYFWGKRIEESKNAQDMLNDENEIETILNISSDDDLDSIETELNSTNLQMDSEIQ